MFKIIHFYLKYIGYILILTSLISIDVKAQEPIQFQHTYGQFDYNYGMCVAQTSDTSYVILANVSGNSGNNNIYLFKIDKVGTPIWDKLFDDSKVFWAEKMAMTTDSGFVITGFTNKVDSMGYSIFVLKTNKQGDKEWLKYYGGTDWDFGMDIITNTQNHIYLTGSTYNNTLGENDLFVLKLYANGDSIWARQFGGLNEDEGRSITFCQNGDVIAAGFTKSMGAGESDALLLRYNTDGDLIWQNTYGGIDNDKAMAVKERPSGQIIFGGITASFGGGGDDFYLVNTDSAGQLIWYETMGAWDNERAYSIDITNDNGVVLAGTTSGPGYHDIYFYKTDAHGQWHYSTSHGMSMYENHANHIIQTLDGGYIIVGYTNGYGNNLNNILVVKTSYTGLSAPYNHTNDFTTQTPSIQIYPNPIESTTHIIFEENTDRNYELLIINTLGTVIRAEIIPANSQTYIFDKENISAGIYFYHITDGIKYTYKGKLIVK